MTFTSAEVHSKKLILFWSAGPEHDLPAANGIQETFLIDIPAANSMCKRHYFSMMCLLQMACMLS
jgi:hypothetical protein